MEGMKEWEKKEKRKNLLAKLLKWLLDLCL
jgi:hypothetical protein